ncbi:MAG: hypothetical protein QME52_12420 [Bacteroidota bacterium]|nr:hypothetical protein [Bacteroidota bacterium]MDI6767617.1 hypothetical protein [Bacteroidota bacterium]
MLRKDYFNNASSLHCRKRQCSGKQSILKNADFYLQMMNAVGFIRLLLA